MADKPTYAELEQRIRELEAAESGRQQAYAALEDSETRYRELFNHIKSGVAIYAVVEGGKDFIFKDFNRAGERLDGDRREDLVGKSIFKVRPGVEQFGLTDVLRRVWETGIPETFPAKIYQDDRLSKWYENFVYRLPSGEIVAVFDDVTAQKQAEEILRGSEKKNQILADIISLGSQPVGVGFPDGKLGLVNTAFEHLTGYSFAELRAIDWAKDLTPPEWLPMERVKLAELHETGEPVRYEKEYIRKDGHRVPVELFVHLARTSDGKPEYYYSYITDITARKQAEEALRESEHRFSTIFHSSPIGIALTQLMDGVILDVNDAFLKIFGFQRAQVIGHSTLELNLFPDPEDRGRLITKLQQQGHLSGEEAKFQRSSGEIGTTFFSAEIIELIGKKLLLSMISDITEHKLAEQEIRNARELFQTLFTLGPVAYSLATLSERRMVDVNAAWENLFGYTKAEVIGHLATEFDFWQQPEERQRAYQKLLNEGRLWDYEYAHRRKSGEKRSVAMYTDIIEQGGTKYILSVFIDLTERKEAEQKLRESEQFLKESQRMAKMGSWRHNLITNELHWSENCWKLYGYEPNEIVPTFEFFKSMVHPEDLPVVETGFECFLKNAQPAVRELRIIDIDGRIKWLYDRVTPVVENGRVIQLTGVQIDITERKQAEQELRRSEMLLREIGRIARIGGWEIDVATMKQKWTGETYAIHDRKQEEYDPNSSEEISHFVPGSQELIGKAFEEALTHGKPYDLEVEMVTVTGNRKWVRAVCSPLIVDGKVTKLTGTVQDITDRKQAEEKLRLEKEKLDKIAGSVPGIICSFHQSPTGHASMPYASPATKDVYGLDPQDIADDMTPIFSRILPEDVGPVSATIARSAQTMAVWKDEYRYQHPTKGLVWIEGHSAPVENADGSITWHGYITDITARKEAEEKLKESEEKLRLLIEHAPTALAMFDHEMHYIAASHRWISDFHLQASNLIGKSHYEVFPEITAEIKEIHQRGLRGETLRNDGAKFGRIDGSVQWLRWEMRPWYTAVGSIGGIVIFSEDITERKLAEEKLRESEARFQSIFENSPVAIAISRVSNQLIMNVNAAFVNMYGFTREEIIGRTTHELGIWANPADRQRFIELLQTQQPVSALETTARLKSGQERRVLVWGERIELRNEPHMLAQIVDITELKQAEEERTKLAALVEASPNFIGLSSIDGQVQYLNRAGRMLVGLADADMTQMKISEFAPPDSASFAESQQAIMLKGQWHGEGELINFQTRARVPVEIQLFLIPSAQSHQPITMGTVMQDISEKKRAELALRESEAKFRNFAEQSFVGFYIIQDGRFKYVNPKFAEIFGYTVDECTDNLRTDQLVYADDLVRVQEQLRRRLSGEIGTVKYTFRAVKKTGEIIHLSIYGSSLLYQGRPAAIGTVLDITKELEMEQRVTQSQRLQAIGLLAGGIAHDFNNILTPIVGLSGMLIEDLPQDSPVREDAGEIYKAGIRGSDLVKQILTFSRKAEQQKVPVRLQKILNETLKLIRATIPANINIKSEIQGDCGLVLADPTQIHQIAMNLITNAYHAVEPKNGEIGVRLREVNLGTQQLPGSDLLPGRYALLSISDTGIGIDPAIMHKIFEPYFTTKAQGKGTGLGLAVVYGIVKEHLGEIKVYSELGKGTTVDVYLPIMAKNEAAPLIPDKEKLPTGYEHILLIDDEKSVVSLEKKMLEQLGYIVTTQGNSLEALELFQSTPNRFDLVISDMAMPNMTGEELARAMLAIRPDIPIIICTGFSERLNQENAATFGVAGFLMKPLAQANLAKMVRKVLDARDPHLGHR